MSFREVNDLVTEASRTACSARPRSLTFRPVHDGPAEIAAPLKLVEDSDANPASSSRGISDVDGDILDCDELPVVKDAAAGLPPGVEILPNGGFEVTESSHSGFIQPMYSTSRVPAPLIRSACLQRLLASAERFDFIVWPLADLKLDMVYGGCQNCGL